MNKLLTIIILCLLIVLMAGCSGGKMETVDMVYKPGPEAEIPKITKEVVVHTVVGVAAGEIIYEDKADKWVRTELAIVSQHPFSLVENSIGKVFKAELVGFDVTNNVAYLHFKNSTQLERGTDLEDAEPESFVQPLTYKERLDLKTEFAAGFMDAMPSEQITLYENPLFKQNPDEIEAFIYDFEAALANYKAGVDVVAYEHFIANDQLKSAFASLSEEAKAQVYASIQVKSINIGEFSTIAEAELALTEDKDSKTVKATYSIIEIDGAFRIVNVQYTE